MTTFPNTTTGSGYVSVEAWTNQYYVDPTIMYSVQLAPLSVPTTCGSITMQDMCRAKEALYNADKKGNKPMRSNNEIKNYFADRAETVFYDLDRGLQKQFGLKDDSAPRTAADVVSRIQAGKFVLPSKDVDYGIQSITWRDPSVVKDTAGYETAYKALKTVRTSTIDQIMADETKALAAVDAFEAWSPAVTASPVLA